jgi:hypothetical protein
MPELSEVAAIIDSGVVVNVAALSSDVDYSAWLTAMQEEHDSVLIVAQAGIGWEEYKAGKVRPPQPGPDCTWNDKNAVWVCPEPEPALEPETVTS